MNKMYSSEEIKSMGWEEFAALEEVQIDQTPTGYGTAMFYKDKQNQDVWAWVKITREHNDSTVWKDQELFEELKEIVEELLEENR